MTWQWWAAIMIYIVGAAGGMAWTGSWYQRKVDSLTADLGRGSFELRDKRTDAMWNATLLCLAVAVWPIASLLVVLYYGITAPFWLGKRIESRKAERRRALAKQHRAQADNLRRMAQDYGRGTTERQILLDGARHLANKADTLK